MQMQCFLLYSCRIEVSIKLMYKCIVFANPIPIFIVVRSRTENLYCTQGGSNASM